ncbi:MAG: TlpA disulfide reductase family protein [Bacteroidota bacterium]
MRKYILIVLWLFGINSYAQEVRVGQVVPNVRFKQIINYTRTTARLSDFKGKWVILDFWGTFCGSCIEAFPKMQGLQDKFGSQLQILLVDTHPSKHETRAVVIKSLEAYKKRTGNKLTMPVPLFDTVLNAYFPHTSVPHEVIIDPKGVVRAITEEAAITEEKIAALLKGQQVKLMLKDDHRSFDKNMPLLVNDNGGPGDAFFFRSVFTGYLRGVPATGGIRSDTVHHRQWYYLYNHLFTDLVTLAFKDVFRQVDNDPQRIRWQLSFLADTARFCYELVLPKTRAPKYEEYLREDLKRAFHVQLDTLSVSMSCWVVSGVEAKAGTTATKMTGDMDKYSLNRFLDGWKLKDALELVQGTFSKPLIFQTPKDTRIKLAFPKGLDLTDEKALIEFLNSAGIRMEQQEQRVKIVVVKDS